jgi:hypothetical protein
MVMNFIKEHTTDSDKELFFGPIDPNNPDDDFHIIEDGWIMAHILHAAGNFPSVSQARKNGWNKPIPEGFTFITVGKKQRKKTIFIFIEKSA